MIALAVAGVVCGYAWFRVRRVMSGHSSDMDDQLWTGTATISCPRSFVTSVFSEVAVGAGASLGREAAPKLLGAALGQPVPAGHPAPTPPPQATSSRH
jgi:chloride channel protein, CIC family